MSSSKSDGPDDAVHEKQKNSDEVAHADGEMTLLSPSGSVNKDPVENRVDASHKVPDASTTAVLPDPLTSILNLNEDPVENRVDASHKVPDASTTATLPDPLASILNLNEDAVENSVDALNKVPDASTTATHSNSVPNLDESPSATSADGMTAKNSLHRSPNLPVRNLPASPPAQQDMSKWPAWLAQAVTHFEGVSSTPQWISIVRKLVTLEDMLGYPKAPVRCFQVLFLLSWL
jgi:hypothetical protein